MGFIDFRDVVKVYRSGEVEIRALDGVSFSLEKGKFIIICGASGAGKSTVLNILGGMDTCTSGEIEVDSSRIDQYNAKQLTDYRRLTSALSFSSIISFRI
jgi:putative ABC transport system ATP-binding protein